MAVTLSTSPQTLSLSRNPIPVALRSNDYLVDPGSAASVQLIIGSAIAPGVVITMSWAAATINFTFAAVPDDSGKQLPSGDGSPAHVTAIVTWLNHNAYLSRDYTIVATGNHSGQEIDIASKAFGINYNLSLTLAPGVTATNNPGTDTELKPNFRHFLQVWRKTANGDISLYSYNLQLDNPQDGTTTKDLQEVLHNYLDYDIPNLTTVWQPCTKSIFEYYVSYGQYFGDKPELQRLYQTQSYFVALGGYSNLARNVITLPDHFQKMLMPDPSLYMFQRWMETYPVDRFTVRTNTPAFLYFINNRNVAETLDIRVALSFSDNSPIQEFTVAGGLMQPFDKVCIACGYEALNLQTHTTTNVKVTGYAIRMIERVSGTNRSVVKYFTVDRNYQPYTRYILYSDSAGNFKTLTLYGQSQLSTEITDSQAQGFPDLDTPKNGNIKRYDIESLESDAINTGFITGKNAYDSLKELLLARYAFRIIGSAMVPIVITSKKFDYSADGRNQNAFKVEYTLAYQEENYTGSTGALIVPMLNSPQQSLDGI